MSWYLANASGPIDQFASISGLAALREASQGKTALKEFFDTGVTDQITECVRELRDLGRTAPDRDTRSTARSLAKLMRGEKAVSITQGFS